MKFLLDVCASSRLMRTMLTDLGHDVLSALERFPQATDEELLALATEEQRVIITEDKDFGKLIFVRRLPHPCVIRFEDMPEDEKVDWMSTLLRDHTDAMRENAIIVVTTRRVRISPGMRAG